MLQFFWPVAMDGSGFFAAGLKIGCSDGGPFTAALAKDQLKPTPGEGTAVDGKFTATPGAAA